MLEGIVYEGQVLVHKELKEIFKVGCNCPEVCARHKVGYINKHRDKYRRATPEEHVKMEEFIRDTSTTETIILQ